MKRRGVLAALGLVGVAGLSGCSAIDDLLSNNPGVREIKWINLDVLRIHFEENHEMDGFAIQHAYDDRIEESLVTQEAPPYSGPRDIRVIDKIRRGNRVYPSRKFKLVGYTGQFSDYLALADETLGEYEFEIPAEIMPRPNWDQD